MQHLISVTVFDVGLSLYMPEIQKNTGNYDYH